MVAVESAIAKIFIDVAVSTGVDVLSKRAATPLIRGAARAYKAFALISTVDGAYNAIRISAYSDAASLISQEAIIEIVSNPVVEALLRINNANFEIHRRAERYLLMPEYGQADETKHPLCGWIYTDTSFPAEDMKAFSRPLAMQASECVGRAVRARDIAAELFNYPEARAERRRSRWDREPTWADRLNTNLGNIFWQPVPEIGLGMQPVANSTYFGIFRRDEPEGYACIRWPSGTSYFGQTRHGFACGYGMFYSKDGSIYAGKIGDHTHLGASISPKRDWVYYGEHQGIVPNGYGRRVGVAFGAESVSGMWTHGKLTHPFASMEQIHRDIAKRMTEPAVQRLRIEYEEEADNAHRALSVSDASVLSHLAGHL